MTSDKRPRNGCFVISLDFELMWGVRDKRSINDYGDNILQVHNVIPQLLQLFETYQVNVTFSTVGFLFAKDYDDLLSFLPVERPSYNDTRLDPYPDIDSIRLNEINKDYYFACNLIEKIKKSGRHEIGSHTFSHYYCLEPGQTIHQFGADLLAARKIAAIRGITVRSLVFPRNQFNHEYLSVCKETGIDTYRGNPLSWLYTAKNKQDESLFRRVLRFLDAYINISGHHTYSMDKIKSGLLYNVAASRFLRPFSKKLIFLEWLKLYRIKKSMSYAAYNNQVFHLWWHPHNFSVNMNENLNMLEKILKHYQTLNSKYNMQSMTMSAVSDSFTE